MPEEPKEDSEYLAVLLLLALTACGISYLVFISVNTLLINN